MIKEISFSVEEESADSDQRFENVMLMDYRLFRFVMRKMKKLGCVE